MTGWAAQALRARAAGSGRGVLEACRRGLDVLDDHRMTLGASELRARATAQGAELAALAQQASLDIGRPAAAADLERALAGHRAVRTAHPAARRPGPARQH